MLQVMMEWKKDFNHMPSQMPSVDSNFYQSSTGSGGNSVLLQRLRFNKKTFISSAFTVLFLLQLLLVPCTATVYQIPLRRFKNSISIQKAEPWLGHHVARRAVNSATNFTQMKSNLNGVSGDGYYIDVDIGTPPQRMQVLIDTGSANFAIASVEDPNLDRFFHRENSSSFVEDGTDIYVPYTEGEWNGVLGKDVVSIASTTNVTAEIYISCITESKDFFISDAEWQGILGLAYAELARPDSSYLPFWDSVLVDNPNISNIFSMQLCGSSFVHTKTKPLLEGSLVVGGIVPSMAKSPIFYTPIYKQWYYEVVLTDIEVGGKSLGLECKEYNFDKTIVDSGTTNIRLPVKVFNTVVDAIENNIQTLGKGQIDSPGQFFYTGEDIVCFEDMVGPFAIFPVLSFYLLESDASSFRLDITPQHYLRPVGSSDSAGIFPTGSCVKFGISSSTSGTVLGAVFMEAFYVVFDRQSSRVGFAQTTCPLPDPDHVILDVTIHGPFSTNTNLSDCAYKKPESGEKTFVIISYVMAAMSVIVVLPLLVVFFMWTRRQMGRRNYHDQDNASETLTGSRD